MARHAAHCHQSRLTPAVWGLALSQTLLTACEPPPLTPSSPPPAATTAPAPVNQPTEYYGTLEPFVGEAVYFVITDRFVNGDPGNDQRDQGGAYPSFGHPGSARELPPCAGVRANIGYLGGDFKGIVDHADYIRDMGFSALWITPIVENPDQSFSGGDAITCDSILSDHGKSAYHGYWGMNFYRVDEHWESPGLDFAGFTRVLREKGLKTVLDIVGNHSSPAWGMDNAQARATRHQFGQVYAADGRLLADHQNLPPNELDPHNNPLHSFYNTQPDLAQLGDFNPDNPAVLDYLSGAYLQWIDQGAAAFRIDTIRHLPHRFWKAFSDRIREQHPGFFMFAEAFDHDAHNIAPHTWPENGGVSVLDFPLRGKLADVFEHPGSDYGLLSDALHLEDGLYHNPYELATFYDNHDMARLNARDEDFINAHNWLFTARGMPVVYYGSEIGFMRGRREHAGNRNYFGPDNLQSAHSHPIHSALTRIAKLRQQSPALQRGLQLNLELNGNRAAFYRVFQHNGTSQTALVLLNKGDATARFEIAQYLQPGSWLPAFSGYTASDIREGETLKANVPAHDVAVFFNNSVITDETLKTRLDALMVNKERRERS